MLLNVTRGDNWNYSSFDRRTFFQLFGRLRLEPSRHRASSVGKLPPSGANWREMDGLQRRTIDHSPLEIINPQIGNRRGTKASRIRTLHGQGPSPRDSAFYYQPTLQNPLETRLDYGEGPNVWMDGDTVMASKDPRGEGPARPRHLVNDLSRCNLYIWRLYEGF